MKHALKCGKAESRSLLADDGEGYAVEVECAEEIAGQPLPYYSQNEGDEVQQWRERAFRAEAEIARLKGAAPGVCEAPAPAMHGEHRVPQAHAPSKRWPFVESPGAFTERLSVAMQQVPTLLAAVRYVLIENPPTLAAGVAAVGAPSMHALVPVEPDQALLRPFCECPPDELPLAWAAMLRIAEVKQRRTSGVAACHLPGCPHGAECVHAKTDGRDSVETSSGALVKRWRFHVTDWDDNVTWLDARGGPDGDESAAEFVGTGHEAIREGDRRASLWEQSTGRTAAKITRESFGVYASDAEAVSPHTMGNPPLGGKAENTTVTSRMPSAD